MAAEVPAPSFYDAVQSASSQQLRGQALRNAGLVGLAGLGIGAGGRGIIGLLNLLRKNMTPEQSSVPGPTTIQVFSEDDKEPKMAGFLDGGSAKTVAGVPWAMPASFAAGAGGLYGGWKLMDYLMDKRRKADVEAEVEAAKKEYEQALLADAESKVASDLGSDLDELYDAIEKRSIDIGDLAGQATGMYGIYGGASGLAAALMMYNWGKQRQNRTLLEKALKKRRRILYARQPAALYARPVPANKQPAPQASDPVDDPNPVESVDELDI